MPKDEQQKEAWELAWEQDFAQAAKVYNATVNYQEAPVECGMRTAYERGYLAAKADQEAAVRAGQRKALREAVDALDAWGDSMSDVRGASEVVEDEIAKYSDEPTKEPTERPIVPSSTWAQSIPPGIHVKVLTVGEAGVSYRWSQGAVEKATHSEFRLWFQWVSDPKEPT